MPPRSQRGLSLALNASVALDILRGPYAVAPPTDLGPAEVDGVATSQYEVEYAPLYACTPHQAPQVLTQRPSRVWLDCPTIPLVKDSQIPCGAVGRIPGSRGSA